MRWPGSEEVVHVRIEGVRLERRSVSNVRGTEAWCGGGLDCGCQLGMRFGGTIIVERRLVSIFAVAWVLRMCGRVSGVDAGRRMRGTLLMQMGDARCQV